MNMIFSYQFEKKEPTEKTDPVLKAFFQQIKRSIDKREERNKKISDKMRRNKNAVKNFENISKQMKTDENRTGQIKQKNKNKNKNEIENKNKIEIENKIENKNLKELNKISEEILVPSEQKEYWNLEINELIKTLKEEAEKIWIAYDPTDERMFAKHILTAKEFWKLADRYWISRVQFAVWIMNASVQINYRKGACSWPKKIYQNTAEVFNEAIRQKQKEAKNKIASF